MQTPSTYPNDPKAFLEHASYLRRLARGFIGDPGAAEDLVQEAWLASLRARPRAGVSLRAWLAGWVRHRSMQNGREERRRARREEVAARRGHQSPESETLERIEVLQFVLRTVEALDEPYRTALRLRFVDDLSAREVADRLGVPLATVRTQLSRGLALARAKLDADCPGGRAALLSALAPLTGLSFPAAGAVTGTWVGATFMQSKISLSILVAVLIGCSLFVWRLDRPGAPGFGSVALPGGELTGVARVDGEALGRGAPTPGLGPPLGEGTPGRQVVADAGEGTNRPLKGRAYLGGDTDPFPGAVVRMRIYAGTVPAGGRTSAPAGAPLVEDELVADAKGQLNWGGPHGEGQHWIELTGAMPNHTAVPIRVQVPADGPTPELLIWLHPLNFQVSGHVRSEGGKGIAGARVKMGWLDTVSAADGSYGLRMPAQDRDEFLYVSAAGYAEGQVFINSESGASMDDLNCTLREELVVRGRVVDGNGNPIADAHVNAFNLRIDGVRTAADGTYHLGKLDPGRPKHMVTARKSGYVLQSMDVLSSGGQEQVADFELQPGVTVKGRVVDETRGAVKGAELYIGFSPSAYDRLDGVVDEDGHFEFDSVGRGPQTLVVEAPGFASNSMEITVPADGGVLLGVEVCLSKGHSISGHVVNVEGDPVPDLWVCVRHKGSYIDREARPDGEGAFVIDALPESDITLEVVGAGYIRLEHDVAPVRGQDLRLVLQRAGSLAGRVIDGLTGEPVQSYRIRAVDGTREAGDKEIFGLGSSWSIEGHQFGRADGTWDVGREELRVGHVTGVEASAPGYAPSVHPRAVVQLDPDPEDCVIALFPGTRLHGVVTLSSTGLPLGGVRIKRFTADRPLQVTQSKNVHGGMQTETRSTGNYVFEDLPAGDTYLALIHPSIGSQIVGPIQIEPGKVSVEHHVVISLDGRIGGRLLSAKGEPVAGGTVALRPLLVPGHTSEEDLRIKTGADGTFFFEELMNGDYEVAHEWLFSNGRGFRHFVRTVSVAGGRPVDLNLAPDGDATILCRIEANFDLPETVPVWITRTHGADGSKLPFAAANNLGAIARDGVFRLDGLLPGTYQIRPSYYDGGQGGMAGGTTTVNCAAESTIDALVSLSFDN